MQLQDNIVENEYNKSISKSFVRNPAMDNDQPGQSEDDGSQTQEHTIDHIIKLVCDGCQRKCVVQCYGYTAPDDMLEPPENIP